MPSLPTQVKCRIRIHNIYYVTSLSVSCVCPLSALPTRVMRKILTLFQNLSVIILIHLYAKICAKITQNHVSASHLICICLDFYLNKIEIEIEIERILHSVALFTNTGNTSLSETRSILRYLFFVSCVCHLPSLHIPFRHQKYIPLPLFCFLCVSFALFTSTGNAPHSDTKSILYSLFRARTPRTETKNDILCAYMFEIPAA